VQTICEAAMKLSQKTLYLSVELGGKVSRVSFCDSFAKA
jgi:hypothetical protein